jgi:hypothetical protein
MDGSLASQTVEAQGGHDIKDRSVEHGIRWGRVTGATWAGTSDGVVIGAGVR